MRALNVVAAFIMGLALALGHAEKSRAADQNPVTAIDIALEPDATMMQRAEAANARLRKAFPQGYALDATHRPHISVLQRYVRTEDLGKVYTAVSRVLAGEKPSGWTLTAYRYYFVVWDKAGVTVMLIKPTDDLIALQQKLIDAISPFTVATGTARAFFTTPDDPNINRPTIDYVERFVPDSSGRKFAPHVTVGVAQPDYLKKMVAEPFDAFNFSPVAISVYQLGNFGTARKKLKAWEFAR